MPDQSYTQLSQQTGASQWFERVRICIVHTATNVKIKTAPTVAQGPADALGRAVVLDPDLWTKRFAPVVGVLLIGEADLTTTSVTDAELFSAVDAAWLKFFAQPTPAG